MSFLARGITGVASRYADLMHVRNENDTLVRENKKLRAELTEMRRLAEESGRYQRLLGLRDVTPAETVAARVVAVDASPYFRVARVDIDRGDGTVRRGMPVLTPEGVVGKINRVAGKSSDVMLLVDPRSAIDVLVPRTGGRGILRGKSGENGYRCSIEYLARGEPAKEGDAVVTSGLGGAFPRNLAVGHITKIIPGAVGLYQDVEVTPDVDFARLTDVLVVVAPPPAPDPDPAAHHLPAHGLTVYR
jgi:rod shape-determining protein MreC